MMSSIKNACCYCCGSSIEYKHVGRVLAHLTVVPASDFGSRAPPAHFRFLLACSVSVLPHNVRGSACLFSQTARLDGNCTEDCWMNGRSERNIKIDLP